MDILYYPLGFVALLGALVTVHEFGHFLVARWSGVHVVRFSIGFGRPLIQWRDRRGTEFVVAVIPLGGYVSMLGENDGVNDARNNDDADDASNAEVSSDRPLLSHAELTPYWRIAIAAAGPAANFLFAILIYWGLFAVGSQQLAPVTAAPKADTLLAIQGWNQPAQVVGIDGDSVSSWSDIVMRLSGRLGDSGHLELSLIPLDDTRTATLRLPIQQWHKGEEEPALLASLGITPSVLSVVGTVSPDSPAARSGLQPGDWIQSVEGEQIDSWGAWVKTIEQNPRRNLQMELLREGRLVALRVAIGERQGSEGTTGFLGVAPLLTEVRYGLFDALLRGCEETWDKTSMTLSMMKKMVVGLISPKNMMGPVGIVQVAGESVKNGAYMFFTIMALLSISLGVVNLLPVPVLDGGHILMTLIEILRGKPLSEKFQSAALQVGLALIGVAFIAVTYNDIGRLL